MKKLTLLLLVVLSQSVFAKHSNNDTYVIEVSQNEIKQEDALDKCDLIYRKQIKKCYDMTCKIDAKDDYENCINDAERIFTN